MSVVKIVATIVVKPEYRQELVGVFQQLVLASRQEAGNLRYDLHQDIKNPNRMVFFEIWQSQAAVDEHVQRHISKVFYTPLMVKRKRWILCC